MSLKADLLGSLRSSKPAVEVPVTPLQRALWAMSAVDHGELRGLVNGARPWTSTTVQRMNVLVTRGERLAACAVRGWQLVRYIEAHVPPSWQGVTPCISGPLQQGPAEPDPGGCRCVLEVLDAPEFLCSDERELRDAAWRLHHERNRVVRAAEVAARASVSPIGDIGEGVPQPGRSDRVRLAAPASRPRATMRSFRPRTSTADVDAALGGVGVGVPADSRRSR